ncbi:tetratricopeptide repeat protein [Methylocucumis oryzae]|uniref:tetratricopeptide repeat protein n=1 Tax=Methylocucumis oryzae TaxID=1632867 RepID=UPI000D6E5B43
MAFGDDDAAESYLKKALSINPEGLETNYYYGNFLADQDQAEQALSYLKKAINAPIRPEQVFSDTQMQNEAKLALKKLAP